MSRRSSSRYTAPSLEDPAAQAAESLTQLAARAPPVTPTSPSFNAHALAGGGMNHVTGSTATGFNSTSGSGGVHHPQPSSTPSSSSGGNNTTTNNNLNGPDAPPGLDASRSSYLAQPGLQRAASANQAYHAQPSLARSTSVTTFANPSTTHVGRPAPPPLDWRATMTIEERQEVRKRIRSAYRTQAASYDELVELVCAVEEEFLHVSAPSRLDYIKSSLQYDKRLIEKRRQLTGEIDFLQSSQACAADCSSTSASSLQQAQPQESIDGRNGDGEDGVQGTSAKRQKFADGLK